LKTGGLKPQAIFERDEVERMLKGHAIQFEGMGQLALQADVKLNGAGERQQFGHTIFGSESLEGDPPQISSYQI
jgi:hypothetical protein